MSENCLVIIDGNSLVNRAYYAIQKPMITSEGFYTQGIYGFLSILQKIRSDYQPTHMLVAFDRKAPTFRHLEYGEYKAGRRKMPPELAMELPVLKDVLKAQGISIYETDGFEADDIIGTTAKMAEAEGLHSYIITGDRDALQLATDKTSVIINKKGMTEFKLYDDAAMIEEYGFDHLQFIDYKGLRGDSSDNIPGIPGVGDKTATELIKQFGSVENLLAHTDEVKSAKLRQKIEEGAMSAMMSKRLATIVTTVPVDYEIEDLKIAPVNRPELIELYKKLEFKKYLTALLKEEAQTAEENNSAISELTIPELVLISDKTEAEAFFESFAEDDVLTVDANVSENHAESPLIDSLAVLKDGKCYAFDFSGLEAFAAEVFGGKAFRLRGAKLGAFYYALGRCGADISRLQTDFEPALAAYVLNPGTSESLESLALAHFYLTIEAKEGQLTFLNNADAKYTGSAKRLAALEALKPIFETQIADSGCEYVYRSIELPLCKVLAEMEIEGISVDRDELRNFGSELKKGISLLEKSIYEEAGESFNINSPKQLGTVLFEKLGIPGAKKTKTGYSTGAEVLEKLADDYPIVRSVLDYRMLNKLNSTYVEGLLPLIASDRKIRPHFRQTVTATGRLSCTEPNLQNIPVRTELGRELRKVFVPKSDEYIFIGADYSQIELRVLAHMSEDETLINAFNDGLDIHRETASKVFGVPQEEVTPQMRSNAKAVNFGVIYGMSGFGLASELTITRKQAEQYISDYFERFSRVKGFMNDCVASAKECGYSKTYFGRRRNIPEILSANYMERQLGERLAMNTPIQGTAADIIKLAMIGVYNKLSECPRSKLILQIHDELIIEAHRDEEERVREILRESMENAAELKVKLDISLNEGNNWYLLK